MTASRQNRNRSAQKNVQAKEWPEKLTVAQAHRFLGVSPTKLTQLLKQRLLVVHKNPMDLRQKLIKRSDLEALLQEYKKD
jgi:hypothetical protein